MQGVYRAGVRLQPVEHNSRVDAESDKLPHPVFPKDVAHHDNALLYAMIA